MVKSLQRLLVGIFAFVAIMTPTLAIGATANAATSNCADGRCWVLLSNIETRALGNGKAPALPAAVPAPLRVSYFALVQGHRWIAKNYADRGLCSAFLLSSRPWENQGFTSRRC
ncbi:MAG: hypothetical protein NTW76_09940 [Corynebacteriales bacterium]|nr:hypothetical protein [Mycobacteriales bacterium]